MYCFYSVIAGKEFEFEELINGLEDGALMDHRVFTEEGVELLLDVVRTASTLAKDSENPRPSGRG